MLTIGTWSLIIAVQSNCVLFINTDESINHKFIIINKQEINDNVIITNRLSLVQNIKIIINIINILEQPFVIDQLFTSNINWEAYNENIFYRREFTKYIDQTK